MSKYFIQISGKFELSHWTPPEYLSPIGYKPYYFDVETNYFLHIYVLVTKIRYYSIFDWLYELVIYIKTYFFLTSVIKIQSGKLQLLPRKVTDLHPTVLDPIR